LNKRFIIIDFLLLNTDCVMLANILDEYDIRGKYLETDPVSFWIMDKRNSGLLAGASPLFVLLLVHSSAI
jgi:hypothetical protein